MNNIKGKCKRYRLYEKLARKRFILADLARSEDHTFRMETSTHPNAQAAQKSSPYLSISAFARNGAYSLETMRRSANVDTAMSGLSICFREGTYPQAMPMHHRASSGGKFQPKPNVMRESASTPRIFLGSGPRSVAIAIPNTT